jgi:hypothetical protein
VPSGNLSTIALCLDTVTPDQSWDSVTILTLVATVLGAVFGAAAIIVAVLIARRQRYIQLVDRTAEREERARREREESERQDRIARRMTWQWEHDEIHAVLNLGDAICYRIRNEGPYDSVGLTKLGLQNFEMRAEQLATRGLESLRDSLAMLIELSGRLRGTAVPADTEVIEACVLVPLQSLPASLHPHTIARIAIRQDRASEELRKAITVAWDQLRNEWGR